MRPQRQALFRKGVAAYEGDADGEWGAARRHTNCLGVVVILGLLIGYTIGNAESGLWERYTDAGNAAFSQGRPVEAEKQFQAALDIAETLPSNDPHLATSLNNLATVYHTQEQYAQAEPLYQRLLTLRERLSGPMHPQVAEVLERYVTLLRAMHPVRSFFPWSAAEKMAGRAEEIRRRERGETVVNVFTSRWPTHEQEIFSDP